MSQIDGHGDGASDDTLVGGDNAAQLDAGSVRSRRSVASASAATVPMHRMCWLCTSSTKALSFNINGLMFCGDCTPAVRAKHRCIKEEAGKEAVDDDKMMMKTDPDGWREETTPFLSKNGRSVARQELRKKVKKTHVHKTGKRHEDKSGQVSLTKQRFKKYVGWWDDIESQDASSDFDRILTEQGGTDSVWIDAADGKRRDDIDFSEHASATEEEMVSQPEDVPVAAASAARGRCQDKGDRQSRRRSRSKKGNRQESARAGRKSRRSSAGGREHGHAGSHDDSPRPKRTPRPDTRARGATMIAPVGSNAAVGFLAKRETLKDRLIGLLKSAQVNAEKFQASVSSFNKKKHQPVDAEDLPFKHDDLVSDYKDLIHKTEELQKRSKQCKEEALAALAAEAEQLEKTMAEIDTKIRQQLETVSFASQSLSKDARACYQNRRWRITRLSQSLVAGGFGAGLAKLIATALNRIYERPQEEVGLKNVDPACKVVLQVNKPVSELDKLAPALWTTVESVPLLKEFFDGIVNHNKTKATELFESLVENQKWKGVFGPMLGGELGDVFGEFGQLPALATPGGRPWLMAMKMGAKRCGPKQMAVPGYPCVVYSKDDSVCLLCTPLAGAVSRGITADSWEQWFATKDGEEHFGNEAIVLRLKAGEMAYLPPAWWPVATAAHSELDGKKQVKAACNVFPSFATVTLFQKALWAGAHVEAMQAAKHANQQLLESKSSSEMWSNRKTTFDAAHD